jgi:hypothetical protein
MAITYANARYAPPLPLIEAHADAWSRIGAPGAFFTASERTALVAESRHALECRLCERRRASLSPFTFDGDHDVATDLPLPAVELAHRLASDPGRLTRRWFDGLRRAGLDVRAYVEAASVVATAVVVDTLHRALGLNAPALPSPRDGAPSGVWNDATRDEGAWVPIAPRPSDEPTATRLPAVPNIARALSLVPDAFALFFRAFGPHYRLTGGQFAIGRPQVEFVAARVSALNQCFY